MSDKWKHRILGAASAALFVTSAIVPALAPILGPFGVKLAAAAGALGLLATNVKTTLEKSPPKKEE